MIDSRGRVPRPARLKTWARLALAAACGIYAVAALGNGLDRATQQHGGLVRWIPDRFAFYALKFKGEAAAAANDGAAMEHLGRELIDRAPIEGIGPALFGRGAWIAADAAKTAAIFDVAARMGWRVPLTQEYWMRAALLAGDYTVASQRLDAILRQEPKSVGIAALMEPFEASPAGQQALAARLSQAPSWAPEYVAGGQAASQERFIARAPVLMALADMHVRLGCEAVSRYVASAVTIGQDDVAQAVWRAHCPQASDQLIGDGAFVRASLNQSPVPFDWQFSSNSDLNLALTAHPRGGRMVSVSSQAYTTLPFASQLVMLAPGTYTLSWDAGPSDAQHHAQVLANVACAPVNLDWLPASRDPSGRRWRAEVKVGPECRGHWVTFAITAGAGQPGQNGGSAYLADVVIAPVRHP